MRGTGARGPTQNIAPSRDGALLVTIPILLNSSPWGRAHLTPITLLSLPCSAQRDKPFAPDAQWGTVPPPAVRQRPCLLLLLLPDEPAAPRHLRRPAAQQAEALPHHPPAVRQRHFSGDRGEGPDPRPGLSGKHGQAQPRGATRRPGGLCCGKSIVAVGSWQPPRAGIAQPRVSLQARLRSVYAFW